MVRALRGKHVAVYKEARAHPAPLESSPARRYLGCALVPSGHARARLDFYGRESDFSFTQDRAGTVKANSGPYERYITYVLYCVYFRLNTILFRAYRHQNGARSSASFWRPCDASSRTRKYGTYSWQPGFFARLLFTFSTSSASAAPAGGSFF